MSSPTLCERADTRSPARYTVLQRQLGRFAPESRDAVFALARKHIRLAELGLSFPALLLALAYPRPGVEHRKVIDMVIDGERLALVAEYARVPLWLRYMEPRLLVGPLPALSDSAFLRHRIVNHFPRRPEQSRQWFRAVSEGGSWVDDVFALWCARNLAAPSHRRRRGRRTHATPFHLLCLWAWYSGQPHTRAHALIATPWNTDMQRSAAFAAAFDWRDSIELELSLGSRCVEDFWLQPGDADGYTFAPLRTAAEIDAEGKAMRNCVRSYGDIVANGETRLWSVRRDGVRVATLEIGRMGKSPVPAIRQLCLVDNDEAPPDLWLSVHRWFFGQGLVQLPDAPLSSAASLDRSAWYRLWKPFWLAKRRIPDWLPLSPSTDILYCA